MAKHKKSVAGDVEVEVEEIPTEPTTAEVIEEIVVPEDKAEEVTVPPPAKVKQVKPTKRKPQIVQ